MLILQKTPSGLNLGAEIVVVMALVEEISIVNSLSGYTVIIQGLRLKSIISSYDPTFSSHHLTAMVVWFLLYRIKVQKLSKTEAVMQIIRQACFLCQKGELEEKGKGSGVCYYFPGILWQI